MNPRLCVVFTAEVSTDAVSTGSAAAIGIAESNMAAIAISERWSIF